MSDSKKDGSMGDGGKDVYRLPSDDKEVERLSLQHKIHKWCLGGRNYPPKAPILEVLNDSSSARRKQILDVGTGTGVWALEMVNEFPNVDVTGIDKSNVQPQKVPPNVSFEHADITTDEAWETRKDRFDLVHARFLAMAIKDWPAHVSNVVSAVAPGGLLLSIEPWSWIGSHNGTLGLNFARWNQMFLKSCESKGAKVESGPICLKLVQEHPDLESVQHDVIEWSCGRSPSDPAKDEFGVMIAEDFEYLLPLVKPLLVEEGFDEEYIAKFLKDVRDEIWDPSREQHLCILYAWARKKGTSP